MRFIYLLKKKRFYLFLILFFIFYFFTNSYFDDSVIEYVTIETEEYFENIINETITDNILSNIEGNYIETKLDDNNKVSYAYIDAYKALKVQTEASKLISILISDINSKEKLTTMEIPFGYFFTKLHFLSDGLKIPVKLKCYQAHEVRLDADIESYGINSSLFRVNLIISLDTYVQIPFQRKRVELECKILLAVEIINAEVPNFYMYS